MTCIYALTVRVSLSWRGDDQRFPSHRDAAPTSSGCFRSRRQAPRRPWTHWRARLP